MNPAEGRMALGELAVSELHQITVEEAFERIEFQCNPRYDIWDCELSLFGFGDKSNFLGGCGDDRRTKHENMFAMLMSHLRKQVVFGTGKGGYKKYLSKRFIVDFYDEEQKIVYEIDGTNHKSEIRHLKDKIRDGFFWVEHGIRTCRITNQGVEQKIMKRLRQLEAEGRLSDVFGSKSQGN